MPNTMLIMPRNGSFSITPQDESLAMKDAIRSMKLGSKRLSFAERERASRPYDDRSIIIAFPVPAALPVAANN